MIMLVSSKYDPVKVRDSSKVDRSFKYLYMGTDFANMLRWEREFSREFESIKTEGVLQNLAKELRHTFIAFIRQLSVRYNFDEWWLSPFSEQNTFASDIFINICKLQFIKSLLVDSKEQKIIIVADSYYFLRSIAIISEEAGLDFCFFGKIYFIRERLHVLLNPLYNILVFLLNSIKHMNTSNKTKKTMKIPTDCKGKSVLLHTWIDETCFGKDGSFMDRYFGKLHDWLNDNDFHVYVIPLLYNIKRSAADAYLWLTKSDKAFLLPYHYYHFCDYLRACLVIPKIISIPRGSVRFMDIEISHLIKCDTWKRAGGSINFALYLFLPQRLKEAGFFFDYCIDVFEGMIPEKALLLGIRKAFPDALTVGYQHTVFSKNLLCYFIHNGEAPHDLLPRRIVCTGDLPKNVLSQDGVPSERLFTGCALRYEYLWKELSQESKPVEKGDRFNILVALPLQTSAVAEIITKLSYSVRNDSNLFFFIKPHPMMKPSFVSERIKTADWPDCYKLVEGGMDQWLKQSRVLVTTASATLFDALIAGVPAVIIGSNMSLELNPLDWLETKYARTYYEPDDVSKGIDEMLKLGEDELEALRNYGNELKSYCFARVSPEKLKVFIQDN